MHLSDGELAALLDRELSPERQRAARAHLVECSVCAGRAAGLTAAQRLTPAQILRANQLTGLCFNELITFFETADPRNVALVSITDRLTFLFGSLLAGRVVSVMNRRSKP